MEKSLVVTGRTLELALDKAALLLHCDKETVAYETLREGKPAVRGHDPVLWKVRATPVAPAAATDAPAASAFAWDVDTAVPADWPAWAALPLPEFLARLTAALSRLPPLPVAETVEASMLGPARTIDGDFGRSPHTLTHDGHLHINGSVLRGAIVHAAGTLTVSGDVETAHLSAGGSIAIDGGLLGTAASERGDVSCRFAQGARLTAAAGSVTVQESSMHAHLWAAQTVKIGQTILGGTAYAGELLETEAAGSASGVPTLLIAGRNFSLHAQAETMRTEAARAVSRLSELNAQRLLSAETAPERERLWQVMTRTVRAHEHLARLLRKKNDTLGLINQNHDGRVCVEGRVFPNVRIVVDDAACDMDVVTQFAAFSKDYDARELRVAPFR